MNTVLSIGTTAPTVTMHKMAILEDYNIGTLLRGFSNRTQYAIEDMQGLFTFKKFFPAS